MGSYSGLDIPSAVALRKCSEVLGPAMELWVYVHAGGHARVTRTRMEWPESGHGMWSLV